jgi:hypothetical protein
MLTFLREELGWWPLDRAESYTDFLWAFLGTPRAKGSSLGGGAIVFEAASWLVLKLSPDFLMKTSMILLYY